jgi:hypothetical protein
VRRDAEAGKVCGTVGLHVFYTCLAKSLPNLLSKPVISGPREATCKSVSWLGK